MSSKGKQIRSIPYTRSASSATRACEPLAAAAWQAQASLASYRSSPSWQSGQTRQAYFWQHDSLASLRTDRKPRKLRLIYTTFSPASAFLPHGGCPCALQGLASACPNLATRMLCACGPRAVGLSSTYLRLEDPFSTRCKSWTKPKVSLRIGCPSIITDDRGEPEAPMFTPYARHL